MGKVNPQLIKTIKGFKESVAKPYGIERIILFGSSARGEAKKDSDVDLLVVIRKPVKKLISKLLLEWHVSQGIDYPVDFLSYTKNEFEREAKGITLVSAALREGLEI
jgi:predicted nucleotidyltransferase